MSRGTNPFFDKKTVISTWFIYGILFAFLMFSILYLLEIYQPAFLIGHFLAIIFWKSANLHTGKIYK